MSSDTRTIPRPSDADYPPELWMDYFCDEFMALTEQVDGSVLYVRADELADLRRQLAEALEEIENLKHDIGRAQDSLTGEVNENARLTEQFTIALEAVRAFIAKYAECEPVINGMFSTNFARSGVQYSGPNYGTELEALRAIAKANDKSN